MEETSRPSARPPREAATVVLLRPGEAGPEVYLVRRPKRAGFMPDTHVFPGGKIEPADADPALGGDAARAAAVREAFEECGILLARDAAGQSPDTSSPCFAEHRRALQAGAGSLAGVLAAEGLRLDPGLLPWAHWITPSGEPVRFSARFFVAQVPAGQVARHAAGELVDELWATPADILDRERAGEIRLPPPTYVTVFELSGLPTLASVAEAAARRLVVPIMPKLLERGGALHILLPWDREYDAAPGEGLPVPPGWAPPPWSRHVLEGGRFWRR